jgi:hypothetical protein
MKYFAEETFEPLEQQEDDDSMLKDLETSSKQGELKADPGETFNARETNVSWYERIHARYASSRKLKSQFFEEHILVMVTTCGFPPFSVPQERANKLTVRFFPPAGTIRVGI